MKDTGVYVVQLHEGCKYEGCSLAKTWMFKDRTLAFQMVERYAMTDEPIEVDKDVLISERDTDIQYMVIRQLHVEDAIPELQANENRYGYKYDFY